MNIDSKTQETYEQTRYDEAREIALIASSLENQKGTLCTEGNANCCTSDAEVVAKDVNHIFEGFRSGILPIEALEVALYRAATNDSRCPFLDDDNGCSIYEYRPLICISNDTLKLPTKHRVRNIQKICNNRSLDDNVPYDWTGNKLCDDCHKRIQNLPKNHPLRQVKVREILYSQQLLELLNKIHTRETGRVLHTKDIPGILEVMVKEQTLEREQ